LLKPDDPRLSSTGVTRYRWSRLKGHFSKPSILQPRDPPKLGPFPQVLLLLANFIHQLLIMAHLFGPVNFIYRFRLRYIPENSGNFPANYHPEACEGLLHPGHVSASSPLRLRSSSSLQEGPPGFFAPDSQARTVAALVLITEASTVWLMLRRLRNSFTFSPVYLGTWLARHKASYSRIRRASIIPAFCIPCAVSHISSIILLCPLTAYLLKFFFAYGI